MADEATNENPWQPDRRTIGVISRAAFEVDDNWRIVEILHKRFNPGLSVRKLSERVVKLVEDEVFFREERARACNPTHGIEGFGSFSLLRSSFIDSSFKDLSLKTYERCNSHHNDHQSCKNWVFGCNDKFLIKDEMKKPQQIDGYLDIISKPDMSLDIEDHPFCASEHQTAESLLSTVK